jgi:hypothetical protein
MHWAIIQHRAVIPHKILRSARRNRGEIVHALFAVPKIGEFPVGFSRAFPLYIERRERGERDERRVKFISNST